MNFSSFLLMRHEILLLAIILLLLIGEIFINSNKKSSIVHLAIFLFGIHTAVGFLSLDESSLFGGMFRTNNIIHFFKNVLNIGVFILLLKYNINNSSNQQFPGFTERIEGCIE